MARPQKEGLDYFPFDVDFFNDEKIEAISVEFGIKGEIIAIRLLSAIYRNGYFIEWSEALKYKLAKNTNLKPELINEVVTRLVKWGFFEKSVFDSVKILTSKGIQKRYLEATKRRNSIGLKHYCLLDDNNNRVNVYNNSKNEDTNAQSKVNKSKVNNIIEESVLDSNKAHTQKDTFTFNSDAIPNLWIRTFGRNPNLPEQEETQKLITRFGEEKVYKIFKEATLKGFKILQTLIDSLDEKGNIKPKENFSNGTKNSNGNGGTTPEELARIVTNWD